MKNEKEKWESKSEEIKIKDVVVKLLNDDFENDDLVDYPELDKAVDIEDFSGIKNIEGFSEWERKNKDRIQSDLDDWNKRMKGVFK